MTDDAKIHFDESAWFTLNACLNFKSDGLLLPK